MSIKSPLAVLVLAAFSLTISAQTKAEERLEESAEIMEAFLNLPNEDIPRSFMEDAEGIILIPKLIRVGFASEASTAKESL